MAASGNGKNGMIDGINVTPLVDISLVLLIIFMVTARLIVAPNSALKLSLPKAASGDKVQVVFAIALAKDGDAFVDGKPVPSDDLIKVRAEDELRIHPDLRVVIQADGDVPHKRVIHVMDLLSQAHISQIAFGVIPEETQPASEPATVSPAAPEGTPAPQ